MVSAAEHLTARPDTRAALVTAASLTSRVHDDRWGEGMGFRWTIAVLQTTAR